MTLYSQYIMYGDIIIFNQQGVLACTFLITFLTLDWGYLIVES